MHKKSFSFGVGVGILSSVLIMFVAYIIQRQAYFNRQAYLQERLLQTMQELEVAQSTEGLAIAARQIGMGFAQDFEDVVNDFELNEFGIENIINYDSQEQLSIEYPQTNEANYENDIIEQPNIEQPNVTQENQHILTYEVINQQEVRVYIPEGSLASDIVYMFYEAGVIQNQEAFSQFLSENNYNTIIMAGSFILPVDAEFEIILDQILALYIQ